MKKEIKIGIVVFIASFVAIWGINFLKGKDLFIVGVDRYYGVYSRINGLTEASPIYFKGFKVGTVRNITLHPQNNEQFVVTFILNEKIRLPKDSRAEIYSLDLMGSKAVEFELGISTDLLKSGDTIRTSVDGDFMDQVSNEVLPLKDKAEHLITNLDSTLTSLNLEKTIFHLDRTLQNLDKITSSLVQKMDDKGQLNLMLKRVDSLLIMFNKQSPKLASAISNFETISQQIKNAKIDSSLFSLKQTLDETSTLLEKANSGEGSLGLLLSDEELYRSLTDASVNLNRLLMDVRNRPDRYVSFSAVNFGKKVYVSEEAYGIKGIYFQVKLIESDKPINKDSLHVNVDQRIYEDMRNGKFIYSIGQESKYSDAEIILNKVQDEYPQAEVVALENGIEINLKKARKKTD